MIFSLLISTMAQEMTPQPLKSNNYSPAMTSTSIGELLPNPIRWLSSYPIFLCCIIIIYTFPQALPFFSFFFFFSCSGFIDWDQFHWLITLEVVELALAVTLLSFVPFWVCCFVFVFLVKILMLLDFCWYEFMKFCFSMVWTICLQGFLFLCFFVWFCLDHQWWWFQMVVSIFFFLAIWWSRMYCVDFINSKNVCSPFVAAHIVYMPLCSLLFHGNFLCFC